MNDTFITVFELSDQEYPFWAQLPFALFGVFILFMFWAIIRFKFPDDERRPAKLIRNGWTPIVLASGWIGLIFGMGAYSYSKAQESYEDGEYLVVEARIESLTFKTGGHSFDQFILAGYEFQLTDNHTWLGYNTSALHGGAITYEGQLVRISFHQTEVTSIVRQFENHIVKLEILKSDYDSWQAGLRGIDDRLFGNWVTVDTTMKSDGYHEMFLNDTLSIVFNQRTSMFPQDIIVQGDSIYFEGANEWVKYHLPHADTLVIGGQTWTWLTALGYKLSDYVVDASRINNREDSVWIFYRNNHTLRRFSHPDMFRLVSSPAIGNQLSRVINDLRWFRFMEAVESNSYVLERLRTGELSEDWFYQNAIGSEDQAGDAQAWVYSVVIYLDEGDTIIGLFDGPGMGQEVPVIYEDWQTIVTIKDDDGVGTELYDKADVDTVLLPQHSIESGRIFRPWYYKFEGDSLVKTNE